MIQPIEDILALFFPEYCAGCRTPISKSERALCTNCRHNLPRTRFHNFPDNQLEKLFWGRCQLHSVTAFLYFSKDGLVRNLLHELKYKNRTEVGEILGKMLGSELKKSPRFNTVTCVSPVPLHPRKLRVRGYNQCTSIAEGISSTMNIPVMQPIRRIVQNPSQTRKSRYERWDNVSGIFEANKNSLPAHQHILLVDDVITTGSTIEACAHAIADVEKIKLSVAALAFPPR